MSLRSRIQVGLLICELCTLCSGQRRPAIEHWVATWGTAQPVMKGTGVQGIRRGAPQPAPAQPGGPARRFPIPPALESLKNQTVRMVVRSSIGGQRVRVRLSNPVGGSAVKIGAASIAIRTKDDQVSSIHPLKFGDRDSSVIYAGALAVSDAVDMALPPLSEVAISLYIPGEFAAPPAHLFALTTTYISEPGDHTGKASIPVTSTTESFYWLAGLDVAASPGAGTLVAFGDSITDGDQSTPNTNGSWPSLLAVRMQKNAATRQVGIVNVGISGNRVLGDNGSGVARFRQDALLQPGVRWIMILEGINDITGATRQGGTPTMTADDLIAAYQQMIASAHLHGIQVVGCTLTPYGGSPAFSEAGESIRHAVNEWIRTSGAFDAVVDFDAATRDAKDPLRFRAEADSPDFLHPANPGYRLMADSIDLALFRSRGK